MYKACSRLLPAVAVAALAGCLSARADDVTVSKPQTTPVATATAANNTPGNVTVATGGSIIVTSGPAVTINSSNTLTAGATISSSAASNGVGVLFNAAAPLTASLTGTSVISATGTGGANNFGISLVGGGVVTGSIALGTTSSIAVAGDSATGFSLATPFNGNVTLNSVTVTGKTSTAVAIFAPLTGNLTLTGTSGSTGAGGYGLNIAAPIVGAVRNAGSLSAGTAQSTDPSGNPVAGNLAVVAVRVSSGVSGGFLNDRYYVNSKGVVVAPASVDITKDTLVTGTIASTGSAPALWVAPTTGATQALTLGAYGAGDLAYGVVNGGNISTTYAITGQPVIAVLIGRNPTAATILAGGLNSQVNSAISATSLDATATAIDVGTGATVPTILNQGSLAALAAQTAAFGKTPALAGGAAYGIVVEQGANVQTITNAGLITITSRGTKNSAYGIVDQSGTVTNIVNTGTINIAAPMDGSGAVARAIDATASGGAVTVSNSNIIKGNVAFGNGPSTLSLSGVAPSSTVNGESITGTVIFGTGANTLALSGYAVFNTALTSPSTAPVALTLTDQSRLDVTNIAAPIRSVTANGEAVLVVPISANGTGLVLSGAASFKDASTIQLSLQSLATSQNLTIVQAGGGFSTDHRGTLIDASSAPYLFAASAPIQTANTLTIQLLRKTADQIGLTGNTAALYSASLAGLPNGSAESSAIANLPSQSAVLSAYEQILPPSSGRAQLRIAQDLFDNGFGATQARLNEVDQLRRRRVHGVGAWVQEFGNFSRQKDGALDNAFRNNSFGFAGGVDVPLLGLNAVGVAIVSNFATIKRYTPSAAPIYNVTSTTVGLEPYASWSRGPVFVQATALFAYTDYTAKRTIAIGPISDATGANWSSKQYGGGATIGARLKKGRLRITPSNSVTYTQLDQTAYTEQGGGAFDLRVRSQKDHIFSDTGRLALAYLLPLGLDTTLKFEIHGSYQKVFQADPTKTLAQYVNGADWVPLLGDKVDTNKTQYGAMVGYLQENVALKLDYDRGESSGYKDNAFAVTAGMIF